MGRRKKSRKTSEGSKKSEPVKMTINPCLSSGTLETSTKSAKLMDVYSRLALPLLKLNENNILTDSDDEETLEFEFRPRIVFSCNMCLVCMDKSTILCKNCKMVSYCKEEHRDANFADHESLCRLLIDDFGGIEAFRFAKDLCGDLYRSLRVKIIEMIETKMARRLDLWEREIILYPRICRTCRKTSPDLTCCPECTIDFYCPEHSDDHAKWCRDFQVFRRILWMQHRHGHVSPIFPDIARRQCLELEGKNFDQLLLEMFDNNANYRRIDAHTYAVMSLSATAPLTTLFALQRTCPGWKDRHELRIHIVGAEFQFECSSLRVWEKLFLHFLPNLKKLHLEFTGPELSLPNAPIELLTKVTLCRRCKNDKRRIIVKFNAGKLYHDVENSTERADLICLFNPGLYRETGFDGSDTWPKTIERFCQARTPVLVTSYTQVEIPKDIRRIQTIGNVEIILEPQKNPFASVKPDRNFVSDDIAPLMYKNDCLSVVRGL